MLVGFVPAPSILEVGEMAGRLSNSCIFMGFHANAQLFSAFCNRRRSGGLGSSPGL